MFPTLGVSHDRKPDTNVIQLSKCQIIYCRKNEEHQVSDDYNIGR